jgi:hypothetical protein
MSKIKKNSININSVKREICKVYVPLALFFCCLFKKSLCYMVLGFCMRFLLIFEFFMKLFENFMKLYELTLIINNIVNY